MGKLKRPDRKGGSGKRFKRFNFLRLTEGQHIIRLLQPIEEVPMFYSHWLRKSNIECLGVDCPFCQNNQEILLGVDGDYERAKKVTGFNPWQVRYFANVLDRTLVKVHPESEEAVENKRNAINEWAVVCKDTQLPLAEVEAKPSNIVKVLSSGITLFDALEKIDLTTCSKEVDEEGNPTPLGIKNYDVVLVVSGTGRERKSPPVPQVTRNDVVEIDKADLFDLDRALIKLTVEEIIDFRRGVTLKDIFAARRDKEGDTTFDTSEEDKELEGVEKELVDSVKNLLD